MDDMDSISLSDTQADFLNNERLCQQLIRDIDQNKFSSSLNERGELIKENEQNQKKEHIKKEFKIAKYEEIKKDEEMILTEGPEEALPNKTNQRSNLPSKRSNLPSKRSNLPSKRTDLNYEIEDDETVPNISN